MNRLGHRPRRLSAAVALGAALCAGLTGCSWQSFALSRPAAASSPATTTHPATATHPAAASSPAPAGATPAPVATVRGDLSAGSVTHVLSAGAAKLAVTYWTDRGTGEWTAALAVPVHLSASVEGAAARTRVVLSRCHVTYAANALDGRVLRDDAGSFVVASPYSYGGAFVLPGQPASTRTAIVTVEYDLLLETAPGSGQYTRQTVLDTLHLTYSSPTGAQP